jgi:pseudouridine-5'-phosphate glycosidase
MASHARANRLVGHLLGAPPSSPLPLVLTPEVRAALADGKPVVALESTIISHGMPYPQNFNTALEVW